MSTIMPNSAYEGKDVFVGIDVHKRTYSVVARVEGTVVKKWTTSALPQALAEQLLRFFAGAKIHSVYEAGFSGFVLHRVLTAAGIESIVVHPSAVEVSAHNRVKTDQRDARKLSEQLEARRLRGIRIPTEREEQQRLLTRTRDQFVSDRNALKNQIRMKCHQFGLIAPDDQREMTHKLVKELLQAAPCPEFTLVVEAHWRLWKTLDQEIQKLEQELKHQAQDDVNEATYRSAPGIGPLSARILSNELGNLLQFHNERQLFSMTGLTPSEHSSGESVQRGHITKQGNPRLRGILVEAAWRAIRVDPVLGQFFERVQLKRGKKRAIVAVARKLIGRLRAAFQQGVSYQIGYRYIEDKAS